jgi:hypothetical protein
MESMRALLERGPDDDDWTPYNPSLGRPILNTAKFLAPKPAPEAAPAPASTAAAASAAANGAAAGTIPPLIVEIAKK